jgi:23S rRNA (cytosine1962-C5)-methyltransferase
MSGSIERVEGEPEPGATVEVRNADGERIACGDFDPASQIRVRLHTFGSDAADPGEPWIEARLDEALDWRRERAHSMDTDALRFVNAEADGLPGLVVDRYADWLVLKAGTPAMLRRVSQIARHLEKTTEARGAWLRGTLPPQRSASERTLFGDVPDEPVQIRESLRRYWVDLRGGQKTGFYLDQRDGRDLFGDLAAEQRTLDLFSYTGGFSQAALHGKASHVVAVETSDQAVELLRRNAPDAEVVQADVHAFLRDNTERFDLVVCDPPPLARRRRDVQGACRAYKDLNLRVLRNVRPGAYVMTFTCSHHVGADLFRKVIFGAATDAGARVQVLRELGAPMDHPVALHHPQGEYLNGLLLRVVEPGS